MNNTYDTLVVVVPSDYGRLQKHYGRLKENLPGNLIFVGNEEVGTLAEQDGFAWMDENSLIPFNDVHALMSKRLAPLLNGRELPRRVTGWYYQQFLKMQYAFVCDNEYYMVWDGDTIPCHPIQMFQPGSEKPYFDLKTELHEGYFETLGRILPGMKKVISRSFISEHMLFKTEYMREMIAEIEGTGNERFWEKILYAIPVEKIQNSDFSEFETYGTYCALRHMNDYVLREWHSFRLGGEFFDPETISERDFKWLGKDFDAISFEKGHSVREDHRNLFDNPKYQEKLSARQMLESIQDLFNGGYVEVWSDSATKATKETDKLKYLSSDSYQIYESLGEDLKNKNIDQAYLCFENAAFLTDDPEEKKRLTDKEAECKKLGAKVKKTCIIILSYNNCYLLQKCIESIKQNCSPEAYSLLVFDNASTDGVTDWLRNRPEDGTMIVLSEENLGFAGGNNAAAAYADPEEDILFLNNDTRMPANALFWLRMGLYSADDVGAVGSVQNYSSPDQLENVEFSMPEEYMEYGAGHNIPMDDPYEEKPKISGFAFLTKNELLYAVNGFDEQFSPGYFEDDDLSMRIRQLGYRLLVCHNSFIYHAGSQSFAKRDDLNTLFARNRKQFAVKWGYDSSEYAAMTAEELEMIDAIAANGYSGDDYFRLLYIGAGCGNALSRIKYLYPKAELTGVEENDTARAFSIKALNILSPKEAETLDADQFDIIAIRDRHAPDGEQITLDFMAADFSQVKLILWDMDDTFWKGTLSEGDVDIPNENRELLLCLVNHGIVNSISSKNDEAAVKNVLQREGLDAFFVFCRINWNDKGPQIAEQIKSMGLRPENTLFIDDNPRNLAEAEHYAPGIMTSDPAILPRLNSYFKQLEDSDPSHERLSHYRMLENKNIALKTAVSKDDFLHDSDIRLTINRDCLTQIDRIAELVERTNQLNYTKNRDSRALLEKLTGNDWNDCAYIHVWDKYGDYGIVGFYCYNTREQSMEHFLFSCRVLGMGIEQYVYQKLGCPSFETAEPVACKLDSNAKIDWIREQPENATIYDNKLENRARILLKGPCDLSSMEPYLSGGRLTTEFNYVDKNGVIVTGQNHSMHIYESATLSPFEIETILNDVPFLEKGDFMTRIFSDQYHLICYSLLQDAASGLYRNKKTGYHIAFGSRNFPLTDPVFWPGYINGEIQNHNFAFTNEILERFSENWEFAGNTTADILLRNLEYIYDNAPGKPIIALILGSETDYEGTNEEFAGLAPVYREINPQIRRFAKEHDRIRLIEATEFIHSQEDFADCINHFSRKVYYEMSGKLCGYINEAVQLEKAKKQALSEPKENSDLTILVLAHNEKRRAKQAIEKLRESELPENTQVILVDNASTDGLRNWAADQADISYVYMDNGLEPWGSVLNQVIEAFRIDTDIMIMQSRYQIVPDLIRNMQNTLYSRKDLGAVGCVSAQAGSYHQQSEEAVKNFEDAVLYAAGHNNDPAEPVIGLEGSIIMLRREAMESIRGFNNTITSLYVLARDLSLRIGAAGYKMAVCRNTIAFDENCEFSEAEETMIFVNEDQHILEDEWGMHYFNLSGNIDVTTLIQASPTSPLSILEIGCDCGATLLYLKNRYPNSKVYGCDIMEPPIRVASRFLDKAVVADIEKLDLPFEKESLDYVIFADVLEHLRNPEKVLVYIRSLLKPGGKVIANIPNLMHISVIKDLLNGNFTYTEIGLLDKTHIHLFTYNEIIKMFIRAGYKLEFCGNNESNISEDEEMMIDRLLALGSNTQRFMYEAFQYQIRAGKE